MGGTTKEGSNFSKGIEDGGLKRKGGSCVGRNRGPKEVQHVFSCLLEISFRSEGGEGNFFKKEIDGENITFHHGVGEIALVTAIMFR